MSPTTDLSKTYFSGSVRVTLVLPDWDVPMVAFCEEVPTDIGKIVSYGGRHLRVKAIEQSGAGTKLTLVAIDALDDAKCTIIDAVYLKIKLPPKNRAAWKPVEVFFRGVPGYDVMYAKGTPTTNLPADLDGRLYRVILVEGCRVFLEDMPTPICS